MRLEKLLSIGQFHDEHCLVYKYHAKWYIRKGNVFGNDINICNNNGQKHYKKTICTNKMINYTTISNVKYLSTYFNKVYCTYPPFSTYCPVKICFNYSACVISVTFRIPSLQTGFLKISQKLNSYINTRLLFCFVCDLH